jgi:hypothetical protein
METANMDTAIHTTTTPPSTPQSDATPVVALASTVAFAAAGTLLAYSLFPSRERRLSVPCQLCLGALVAFAGIVTWKKREEEVAAARHLVAHVHEARDAHWLKKHPIAYA